jgi:hypothetical protein
MTVGVYLITDGKSISERPVEHTLNGASIGLVHGFLFEWKLKLRSAKPPN